MRFFSALIVWLSGGFLLYSHMRPIYEQFRARFDDPDTFQALSVLEILQLFAWPFFILGVMMWVAVPGAKAKKTDKATKPAK